MTALILQLHRPDGAQRRAETSIIEAVGFTHGSRLNRIFRKVAHILPGQYRRMLASSLPTNGESPDENVRALAAEDALIASVPGPSGAGQ